MPIVLIDDTNSSIQYSGPWFEVENTQIDTGAFGPPYQNTLHGVTVNANLSFPFSGSEVLVYGTSITTNVSGTQDPAWECFIDNTSIGGSSGPSASENNWILCGGGPSQFQDGPHLLTVKANVSNQQTFWFDQIQYVPSASVSLNQSILRIDSSDSAIQYSSGWQSMVALQNTSYTQITGAALTYQFTGTSLSWVGTTYPLSNGSMMVDSTASATYTIDDQDPINFIVPISSNANSYFNQITFETGQLSLGQHKLVVTYFGNTTTAPLALNYFVQLNSPSTSNDTPTSTSVPSGTSSPSSSTSNVGSSSSSTTIDRKPTGAIVGGVVGGLVLISLLLALFFFIRRRNNRKVQALSDKSNIDASLEVADPFIVLPSTHPTSTFLPQNYTSNGQSLPSQFISSRFTQKGQLSDPASTPSRGGLPPLTPLRPQLSSPAFTPPSGSSSHLPLTGSQINLDGTKTEVPQAEMEPLMQSPQGANARFLLHEDSGVRIPRAETDVVELPPFYTPG